MQRQDSSNVDQLSQFSRIGMFDSGIGGLSVLKKLTQLPGGAKRTFVYLGDTARCPYGNRPPEEIATFVQQIVGWLLHQKVDAIVMACNTSAAVAREAAERCSTVPLFDLITPTAGFASAHKGKIGVMATASTAKSRAFSKAIRALNAAADVVEYGCPELVPIVESGSMDSAQTRKVLSHYIKQFEADAVETVILGCTHFPFLRAELDKVAAGTINFVDPAEILTGIKLNGGDPLRRCDLYVTGSPRSFARAVEISLGHMPSRISQISIDDLEAIQIDHQFAINQESLAPPAVSTVVQ